MIFRQIYKIGIEDIGQGNYATNNALLSLMEDVGCLHSAEVGYGVFDIETKQQAWLLLDWQIRVLKRPLYNEKIEVCTWSRHLEKIYAYRDYKMCNEQGEIIAVGTSRWVLFDVQKHRPVRLTEDIAALYQSETGLKAFLEELADIPFSEDKLEEAVKMEYHVQRRDIDMNQHMHNIHYLDAAYEALPQEVYEQQSFDSVRIRYKREIKLGDVVTCAYYKQEDTHIVAMLVEDKVHALVALQ